MTLPYQFEARVVKTCLPTRMGSSSVELIGLELLHIG